MTARLSPENPLSPSVLKAAKRILLIKLDGVGDFVLLTPFLDGLRKAAPAAEISLVVLPTVLPLAAGCPHIDIAVAPRSDLWSGKLNFQGHTPSDLKAFAVAFRAGFDLAVVPRFDVDNKGATPLIAASKANLRVAFSEGVTPWKAGANVGFDAAYTHVLDDTTPRHETEHNTRLLKALGGTDPGLELNLYLNEDQRRIGAQRLTTAWGGTRPDRVYAVVATSGGRRKDYPIELFARLLMKLAAKVVVLAAPDDGGQAAGLVAAVGADARLWPASADVADAAAILAACDALVSVDSGPAHMAAALGLPVAVLSCHPADGCDNAPFSPLRYRPLGRDVLWLQPDHAKAPCTDMCLADGPHCITGIDPLDAAGRIERFLAPLMTRGA